MKRAIAIFVFLTMITVCLPPFAAAEEMVQSHVREHVYPGPGAGAYFDAVIAEQEAGLPSDLAAIYGGDPDLRGPMRHLFLGELAVTLGLPSFRPPVASGRPAPHPLGHPTLFHRVYGDTGMGGAGVSYRLMEGTELSAFGAVDTDSGEEGNPDSAYGVEMATRASVLDMAIRYAEARDGDTGLSSENALIPVRWRLVSAGVGTSVGNLGLHAEGAHAWLRAETDGPETKDAAEAYSHFLLGIDYTFNNNLYLVLEYFQDDPTAADGGAVGRTGLLTGEGEAPGRDNFLVGARYPITDLTSIEFYNIVNNGETSIMVNPWLILSAGDVFRLKLSAQIPFSKNDKPLDNAAPAAFGGIQLNF